MLVSPRLKNFFLPQQCCFQPRNTRRIGLEGRVHSHYQGRQWQNHSSSSCRASVHPVEAEIISDPDQRDHSATESSSTDGRGNGPEGFNPASEAYSSHQAEGGEANLQQDLQIEWENPVQEDSDDEEETGLVEQEDMFHTVPMEGCEVLLRTTEDGRFDLQEVYIYDTEVEVYAEPERIGSMPATPHMYLMEEWKQEFTGDTLMDKPAWEKILKLYLVQVDDEQEHLRLKLEEVFCIDAETRTLRKEEVTWRTEERDPQNITLRIRPEGCTIEENSEMIDEYTLVENWHNDQEMNRRARAEEEDRQYLFQEEPMSPRDPIDALNDDDREYDETFEDTPEVDQGY